MSYILPAPYPTSMPLQFLGAQLANPLPWSTHTQVLQWDPWSSALREQTGGLQLTMSAFLTVRRSLAQSLEKLKTFAVLNNHFKKSNLEGYQGTRHLTINIKEVPYFSNKYFASWIQDLIYSALETASVPSTRNAARSLNPSQPFPTFFLTHRQYILSHLVGLSIYWKLALLSVEHCYTLVYSYWGNLSVHQNTA